VSTAIDMPESTEDERRRATPERTCVGCRQRDDRDALLRFVLGPDGQVVPDLGRKLPGRGASVHPRRACLEVAVRRGGFARGFRRPVDADLESLVAMVVEQLERRLTGLLLAAQRSGNLTLGTDAVRDRLREQPPALLLVAGDAAGRREELLESARRIGEQCVVYGNKTELGRLFGRSELGVLAVADRGIAGEVARVVERVAMLQEDDQDSPEAGADGPGGVRTEGAGGPRTAPQETERNDE